MSDPSVHTQEAAYLESPLPVVVSDDQARLTFLLSKVPQLQDLAASLFPGSVEVEIEQDPELPGRKQVIVQVEAEGDLRAVAQRRREWYKLSGVLLGDNVDLVLLAVTVR